MITVDDTIAFIKKAHAGQTDKAGVEYWRHPVSVMSRIPDVTEHECHVALLHDVIEDTKYTAHDLLAMGYPFDVVWDVNTITRRESSGQYKHWIMAIAVLGSAAAIRVKIADLADNLDPERLNQLNPALADRLIGKYSEAIQILRRELETRTVNMTQAQNKPAPALRPGRQG